MEYAVSASPKQFEWKKIHFGGGGRGVGKTWSPLVRKSKKKNSGFKGNSIKGYTVQQVMMDQDLL